MLPGFAVMVKSWTINVIVVEREREPLDPVTVTEYVPGEPLHESVEFAELLRVRLDGPSWQLRPVEGEMESESKMIPVKPFRLDTVIVDVLATPGIRVSLFGLAAREKSWIVNTILAECERGALVPVTVIE